MIFDKIICFFILVGFTPVICVCMFLIFWFENDNPIFIQERVGKNRKMFNIYKLRTMHNEVITKTGQILRKYRLDELPQLINVIKGDMTLIGPRPLIEKEYKEQNESFYKRTQVLPGVTGWAQINGPLEYPPDKIHYDMYYIHHKSFSLDMYILLITARTVLTGKRLNG
jgi:lipopolysaccharide/colanic/teichoic acid biosynthesis glycosyltransferase